MGALIKATEYKRRELFGDTSGDRLSDIYFNPISGLFQEDPGFLGLNKDVIYGDEVKKLMGDFKIADFKKMKEIEKKFYIDATTSSKDHSIFTHDSNVIRLLEPVSKAFADGKQTPAVVMAPDQRNQSVTKLGDSYSGNLSSRVQDNTALMLAYTKNLHSTTGQFA
jgi:hypothetical protein